MLKRALQSIKERDVETLVEQLAEVRRELDQPELFPDLEGEWNLLMSMRWFLEPRNFKVMSFCASTKRYRLRSYLHKRPFLSCTQLLIFSSICASMALRVASVPTFISSS